MKKFILFLFFMPLVMVGNAQASDGKRSCKN